MATDTPNTAVDSADAAAAKADEAYAPEELKKGAAGKTAAPADVNLDLILEVPVNVSLQVGSTEMPIKDLVRLVEGSVIALDRLSSEPMDVLVNGTLIAHGEIVLVDDHFGVRLTDVVSPIERIEKLA
jgi:flagellar motor switch protein FliN/FliY